MGGIVTDSAGFQNQKVKIKFLMLYLCLKLNSCQNKEADCELCFPSFYLMYDCTGQATMCYQKSESLLISNQQIMINYISKSVLQHKFYRLMHYRVSYS